MRQTCGAACGMFILAGLETGSTDGSDRAAKSHNYAVVQQLAATFEQRNGSLICAELLGLRRKTPLTPQAEARTENYYAKRPCIRMVEEAARIWSEYMESQTK